MLKNDLTSEYIRSILGYNPETGIFTWRFRPLCHFADSWHMKTWNVRFAGKRAGSISKNRRIIVIDTVLYKEHRLAWLWMTGAWPKNEIDHRNLDGTNNKWDNLREATSQQNSCNKAKNKRNTSGYKGVNWDSGTKKWRVKICVNRKHIHIGLFDNLNDAATAYKQAAEKYHGEFRRVS